MSIPVMMTIAGSDCSAGAGLQADLKAAHAMGAFALTAVTCVVSEAPGTVRGIQEVDPALVADQVRINLEHFPVRAVKTGMLYSPAIVRAVHEVLAGADVPVVVDPVMIATAGDRLMREEAVAVYEELLLPGAALLTPNLDEAAVLLRSSVNPGRDELPEAAARLGGRRAYRLAKRAFDAAFSAAVLVVLLPLMALVALAVRLDGTGGPVLFRQVRVGKGGREFEMYKFRTMVPDAEGMLGELKGLNEKTGPVFKIRDDPRVTRVGRFLRRTSLDELPQFANVLKGDMSVVGPRPALPAEVASYGERERQRLLVEQGLTSYWQARPDRDSVSFDEWVDLDLAYVRDCGVATDLKLIVKTVGVVLTAQGS